MTLKVGQVASCRVDERDRFDASLSPSSSMTDCMNDSYISIDMEKLQQFWHFNWYGKTGIWMVLKYAAVSDHDIGKLK